MKLEVGEGIGDDLEVCRYFSFESFVNLVETEQLTFTKVSNWEDPWENELSRYDLESDGEISTPSYSADQHFFGQCWTKKIESDAMWRIYSPNMSGVKIVTKVERFKDLQNTKILGVEKVVYFSCWQELPNLTKNDDSRYQTVRYKRDAFSHEEEVRFITHPQFIIHGEYHDATHINLGVGVRDFIARIEIDPRAPAWIENMIREYSKKRLNGIEVRKSNLYEKNEKFKIVRKYVPVES